MFWKKKKPADLPIHLPMSEGDSGLVPRSSTDVAKRLLAIIAVVDRTHEQPPEEATAWVSANGIDAFFSPTERAYFFSAEPAQDEMVAFSWRAEAAVSLIWALGELDEFPALNEQFAIYETTLIKKAIADPKVFIQSARLREIEKIQEKEQHLHHQHWRVRDAQLFRREMPTELNPGIVYERRYGLSWLVGWGENWDDVPTDT